MKKNNYEDLKTFKELKEIEEKIQKKEEYLKNVRFFHYFTFKSFQKIVQNTWKVLTVVNQVKAKGNLKKNEENKPNPVKMKKKQGFIFKLERSPYRISRTLGETQRSSKEIEIIAKKLFFSINFPQNFFGKFTEKTS